jgi:hypothetical protein
MVLMVAAVLMGGMVAVLGLTTQSTLRSTGSVKALGVSIFSDSACTKALSSVDWGMAEPGLVVNKIVYIKNTGDAPVTLSLRTANWNPTSAQTYMTLSWNYNGQALNASLVVAVTLSLSISSSTQGVTSYSFDILITGTG